MTLRRRVGGGGVQENVLGLVSPDITSADGGLYGVTYYFAISTRRWVTNLVPQ